MNLLLKSLTLFVALLFTAELASSQVLNVERNRADGNSNGWTGELGTDFSLNKYNDRVIKVGGQANASYFSDRHSYLMLSSIDLVNVDGNSLVSNGYVHLRATFQREKTLSPEIFTQYQYNNNLGLQNRALGGAGVRYTFLSRDHLRGHFSTGLMYEYEDWGLNNEVSVQNELLKSTSNLVIRGDLNEQTSLTMIGYYQARPDRFFKPRATSENQLNIRMSRSLTFRVNFTMTYDVEPVIDVPKLTYELKNGIVLSF
ncbi:DUF481 domain-containing protein [Rhodohalobacter halophilus]|uniref:DUF481 domain-containing protein n=1 Tax=Rhodohalobacter halophilus TaxID=1812810 RepID=UPI00114CAF13|nr:DUF481 domain-containing protein [Rhodohalobacter halophilus]